MAEPLKAGIAPNLLLTSDYIVRFTALDPTTGDLVTGVVVSDATIQTEQAAQDTPGPDVPVVAPFFAYEGAA